MTIAKINLAATDVWLHSPPGVTAEMACAAAPNARIWIDGIEVTK